MPQDAAIAVENVSKRFGAGEPVLDGVSLEIERGAFLAVVGASGSGKSTLLRLINRLESPTEGTVRIGAVDAASLDPVMLRRRIGYVFQEIGLFPHMTVAENIAITPKLLGWDKVRMAARVDELLGLVRLPAGYGPRLPHQLSGGERQRVGVARALAAGPDMVLMDEPFAALDPLTRMGLGQDYRALHGKLSLTTLMITHDMVEALSLADRIAVLRRGRLVAQGSPAALIDHAHPYVRELMETPRTLAARVDALLAARGA
ncbi:MAG TPA: ATP-binding cassette domain-containing protein [Hyphomicrobiaceae bacterium]|nr:ATP-binding cassette domain-containing protein [Hyphomicrobiaceae bacterium]